MDAFLSATARLNPNVNVKAIVIGLMDRLSAYATREAHSETPEERLRKEEEAARKLMERLNVTDGSQASSQSPPGSIKEPQPPTEPYELDGARSTDSASSANGDDRGTVTFDASAASEATEPTKVDSEKAQDPELKKPAKGIPDDVKLYEIFYEQVLNLVNVRAHTRAFSHSSSEPQADFRVSSKAQNLPIQDITALLVSLANLALKIYPDRLGKTRRSFFRFPPEVLANQLVWPEEYVDQILK